MDHGRTPNLEEEEGRSSVGGREGREARKGQERETTDDQRNQTVLFILPLFHPNCPPSLSPAFVFYIHLGSQSREETEKREEAPLPSFSPSPLF